MTESLLSASRIHLYGREVSDLKLDSKKGGSAKPSYNSSNKLLLDQLSGNSARIARIYGFAFEGHYYDLSKPMLFVVHGAGTDPDSGSRGKSSVDMTGLESEAEFADDIKVWVYDKDDMTLRMDVDSGTFEQVLLEAELDAEGLFYSGQRTKVSGQRARVSGQRARVSGQRARMAPGRGDSD